MTAMGTRKFFLPPGLDGRLGRTHMAAVSSHLR
jgi:hypothetical protein